VPLAPIGHAAVVYRAAHLIRKAGINVPRAGSHVLRHSCVQRLLNAHFSLKHIGDYVGHRNISSTQIYGKRAIEQLRYVARRRGGCAMTPRTRFKSFLGPDVEQFLAYKRSLGRRYDVEEKPLALLDAYLLQKRISRISEVTPTLVEEFLLSRPRPRARSYNHLRCTIGRFFSYLVDRGKRAATPLQSPPRRSRYARTPFIFDMAAAQRLLALAKTLPDKGGTMERGSTYFVLFAILYGLGLRVGEACRLRIKDIDRERQLLVIRETKFYNSAAFLAMPNRLRLDHEDAGKEPAARHSQVDWIGIVLMAKDP
jgi:site-specific recombinase XerD